jgi:hypothetical protein
LSGNVASRVVAMGGIRAVQRHVHRSDAQHRGEIETVEQALVEVALAD